MPDAVVQRWRIVHGRGAGASGLNQRAELEAWEAAVGRAGLPVLVDGRGRPRLGVSVPLPVGFTASAERIDVPLVERCSVAEVRSALEDVAPTDHPIIEIHDVWIGSPALAAAVVALDYRVAVTGATASELTPVATAIVAATTVPRVRRKSDRVIEYDLRPLIVDLRATSDGLWMRLRAEPSVGVGRPDEVVAAVGEALGATLAVAAGDRERLWLREEM